MAPARISRSSARAKSTYATSLTTRSSNTSTENKRCVPENRTTLSGTKKHRTVLRNSASGTESTGETATTCVPSNLDIQLPETPSKTRNRTATTSSGMLQSRSASTALINGPIQFMSFPPEIRNKVYRMVLNHDRPIAIKDFSRSKRSKECKEMCGRVVKLRADDSFVIQLLRASHAMYREAHGVLYGGNRFVFEDMNGLEAFLQKIGCDSRKHLAHITIPSDFDKAAARSAASMLCDAKHLRNLHFGPCGIQSDTLTNKIWECFKPMFVALVVASSRFAKATDIVTFEPMPLTKKRRNNQKSSRTTAARRASTQHQMTRVSKNSNPADNDCSKFDRSQISIELGKKLEKCIGGSNNLKINPGRVPGFF